MRGKSTIYVVFGLAAILGIVAGILYSNRYTSPLTNTAGSYKAVRMGPADIYPLVPGAINTSITQQNISQNICNPSWSTKSERPSSAYTTALKKKQIAQFGLQDTNLKDYEEDHLISLEIGGNPTDPNNLWPEAYQSSLTGIGAKTKDSVENYLHSQVCAGNMTLLQAQQDIVNDWYLIYVNDISGKYGSVNSSDPDDQ